MSLPNFKAVLRPFVCAAQSVERRDLNRALFKRKVEAPPPSNQASGLVKKVMPPIPVTDVFLHFRKKEATGIPLLGTVLVEFALQLADRSSVVYRVDMEFPVVVNAVKRGQKPACDGALCNLSE